MSTLSGKAALNYTMNYTTNPQTEWEIVRISFLNNLINDVNIVTGKAALNYTTKIQMTNLPFSIDFWWMVETYYILFLYCTLPLI